MTRLVEPLSASERMAMVAAARDLIGTPFRHAGRSLRGVDCIGLVALSLAAVGRPVSDERAYGRRPEPEGQRLRSVLCAHFGEPTQDLQPGVVVTMQWHGQPNHVGVLGLTPYGALSLIHADANAGRVVEHRLARPWDRRVIEGWLP